MYLKVNNHAKWAIYNELIENIPSHLTCEAAFVSLNWVGVRSEAGVGLSMRIPDAFLKSDLIGNIKSMNLKDLASYSKSWDFYEASLGIAAINSFYNGYESKKEALEKTTKEERDKSIFDIVHEEIKGKKVAVVGHFPRLEELATICELSILERKLIYGDYPDPACEYILEEQDYFFTTGVTLINKTYPRLSELSSKAKTFIVGPSTPLTDILFKYGADVLAGSIVKNAERVSEIFIEGGMLRGAMKENDNLAFFRMEK